MAVERGDIMFEASRDDARYGVPDMPRCAAAFRTASTRLGALLICAPAPNALAHVARAPCGVWSEFGCGSTCTRAFAAVPTGVWTGPGRNLYRSLRKAYNHIAEADLAT